MLPLVNKLYGSARKDSLLVGRCAPRSSRSRLRIFSAILTRVTIVTAIVAGRIRIVRVVVVMARNLVRHLSRSRRVGRRWERFRGGGIHNALARASTRRCSAAVIGSIYRWSTERRTVKAGVSISRNVFEQPPGLLIRVIVVTGVMRIGVFAVAVLAVVSTGVSLLGIA